MARVGRGPKIAKMPKSDSSLLSSLCNEKPKLSWMYQTEDPILLIRRLAKDDRDAMKQLFTCYHDKVFRSIYRFVRDYEQSKDLAQEVFLKIWNKRKRMC